MVKSGDTLWTIAGRQYGADADVRHAVFEIRQANQFVEHIACGHFVDHIVDDHAEIFDSRLLR